MLNEEVRKIMTKNPITAHPDDNINDVTKMMLEKRVQQLPVVHEGKLVGMITSYDMWKNITSADQVRATHVKDIMTSKVIRITPIDKVGTAAELFMDQRFKTLPVVNLRNELKGVITAFDVIKHTLTREYPHPVLYSEVFEEQS